MALYAFDGTWNLRDRKQAVEYVQSPQYGVDKAARRDTVETNVHRFREFYGRDRSEYLEGVGTRFGLLGRILGGAFGIGGRHRIRRMYRALTRRYFAGDTEIDIVGFSRGAALAVHFANVLDTHGLRDPANPRHLAWWYYPELGWTFRHPKAGPGDVASPEIDFLGLWDTVASFGLPIWPFRNRSRKWKVWQLPASVQSCCHAMALDEVRPTFALIRPRETKRDTLYELWFRGAHANVGGGYLDRGLSDITLAWMMNMAVWQWSQRHDRDRPRTVPSRFGEALSGLDPEPGPPADWSGTSLETIEPDPNGAIGRPARLRKEAWRVLRAGDKVHHSVRLRKENLVSDHLRSNRPLLRRVPADVQPVFDPPLFYAGTLRQSARRLASEAFARVPVAPCAWLRQGEHHVFRSDQWIVVGCDRRNATHHASRESFVVVATEWLLSGRPAEPGALRLPDELSDGKGKPSDAKTIAAWLLPVLAALEPHLPWLPELAIPPGQRDDADGP